MPPCITTGGDGLRKSFVLGQEDSVHSRSCRNTIGKPPTANRVFNPKDRCVLARAHLYTQEIKGDISKGRAA